MLSTKSKIQLLTVLLNDIKNDVSQYSNETTFESLSVFEGDGKPLLRLLDNNGKETDLSFNDKGKLEANTGNESKDKAIERKYKINWLLKILSLVIFFTFNSNVVFAQIPTKDLLIHYPLNATSSIGILGDASGNNNFGHTSAIMQGTTDRFNQPDSAFYANTTEMSSYFYCNQLDLNNSFTISLWVYFHSPLSGYTWDEILISQGDQTDSKGFQITASVTSEQIVITYSNFGTQWVGSGTLINDSQWHLYTISYSDVSHDLTLYVDGNAKMIRHNSNPHSGGVYGNVEFINTNDDYGFVGKLDDITIYNRELSYTEVLSLYNENKQEQTITLPTIPTLTITSSDITLPSISDDGLPITYTSSDPTVVTINSNVLHIVGEGTALITATQTGNVFYKSFTTSQYVTVSSTTTAITSVSNIESKIFPNPVKDKININGFDNKEYLILNQYGCIIKSGTISSESIDVSDLATGLYFLQINSSTIKIIKE